MATEIVGLKIGASGLSAARVSVNGSARLDQLASCGLPAGVVSHGEVLDADALADALGGLFSEHRLPRRSVRLGISSNRVGVRTIDVPAADDARTLANAVRFRAQEALPIPLSESVMDFQVLSEATGEDGAPARRVLFAVAYRELVEGFAGACAHAGIDLVGIDLEALALLRALTPFTGPAGAVEEGAERSAIVAVGVGSQRSTLAVTDGLSCEFTRVLEWGGDAITEALARDLGVEPPDAELLKRSIDLTAPAEAGTADGRAAREAALRCLQGFARELVSSLQFYQGQHGSLGIRRIVLAGGTARMAGLAGALEQMVAVDVAVGDPLVNLDVPPELAGGAADPASAVAIGLGIGR